MLPSKVCDVVAFGDGSEALYQAHVTEDVYVQPPREAPEDRDVLCQYRPALLCLRRAPKAGEMHMTKKLTGESVNLTQAQSDGCVLFNLGDGGKSGRYVEDLLISGPHASVDQQVLRDIVVDSTMIFSLVGMEIDGSFTHRRVVSVDWMTLELGKETAKFFNSPQEHRLCRTVVGIAVHYRDWRLDAQHDAVSKVCRKVAAPARWDLRRLQRQVLFSFTYTKDVKVRMVPHRSRTLYAGLTASGVTMWKLDSVSAAVCDTCSIFELSRIECIKSGKR